MPRIEDNIAAAVEAVGVHPVGLVWGLANMPWQSAEERDGFLKAITQSLEG